MESARRRPAAGTQRMPGRRTRGITLIELLIVIVIIGILVAMSYPLYTSNVRKARRSDATLALNDLAARLERYYTENNTYATATIAAGAATDVLNSSITTEQHYALAITAQTATAYTIIATPLGDQSNDALCGTFTMTSTGVKTVSGTLAAKDCW
jgi:type IV pilus assembly protein PilE